jgi:site-specific recombinase XerC
MFWLPFSVGDCNITSFKQHLAAIKMLFDYVVISQFVPTNPAAPVKGPTHVVKRGKTPVLSVEDARKLLDSIPTDSLPCYPGNGVKQFRYA